MSPVIQGITRRKTCLKCGHRTKRELAYQQNMRLDENVIVGLRPYSLSNGEEENEWVSCTCTVCGHIERVNCSDAEL